MNASDLYTLLDGAGFQSLRENRREITALCPMHMQRTGKPDSHPSFSINKITFAFQCFSCGYKGSSLSSLLIDVTGHAPADLDIQVKESALQRQWQTFSADPLGQTATKIAPQLTEFHLKKVLRDVPDRFLQRRRLLRSAVDAYQVRFDATTKQVVMPIRTPDGVLLGAQYRQVGSVLTLPAEVPKSSTLFGHTVVSDHDHVALVESPLDAVRLYGIGVPAVSSLGAWISAEQIRLLARTFGTVYLALDNDRTGIEASAQAAQALRRQGCAVVPWNYAGLVDDEGRPAKDPGDADTDEMLVASWERTRRFGLS